ncbi:PhzF family phenazine biosynthesis protein [Agrobacterium vitis]|uniref:PhzF family phenazine biosynthesis protein n=1 Tax=Agrobacterium vitis TaxID=373 RepID=UPI0012E82C5A|nr:PhzF family phenazine biosynthesis protein [Agrobacterium vitis]MCM2442297.1 PhzF family phenazine biosynthesis protein [Agrobacterium vitis]
MFPKFDSLTLWQVDVFSTSPLAGNPAAVIFGGEQIDDLTMQAIARETNLSETVFLLPPDAGGDVRLRIFTTRREIDFAVHPAIAAAHALAEATANREPALALECRLGRVAIHRLGPLSQWHCKVPPARFQPVDLSMDQAAALFGLAKDRIKADRFEIAATGVPWVMVELAASVDLDGLDPDHRAIASMTRKSGAVGVTVFSRTDGDIVASMRSFAPAEGIYEDPVCGSCAGSLGALLLRDDPALSARTAFFVEQGRQLGRPGRISVLPEHDRLWIGGGSCTVLRGQLALRENEWHG